MIFTEAQAAFLREVRFAVLATINPDGMPQQSTMWYDLDGDTVLLNTKAGRRKERNLRRDQRASLCVEDGYRYVTIRGVVHLVYDAVATQHDIRRLAIRYHGSEAGDRQARDFFAREERVSLVLRIEGVVAQGFADEA